MPLAPVIVFVYSRFKHFQLTIASLSENFLAEKTDLYIYSDNAKTGASAQTIENIKLIREYCLNIKVFKSITIINREKNFGLANNIISGVTEVINRHGKVIVLEDDMLTSRYFLTLLNECLLKYQDEEILSGISGYQLPIKFNADEPNLLLTKLTDCWGWATWKRAWHKTNWNTEELRAQIIERKLVKEFNLEGSYNYLKLLENDINGKINSWAIKWYASNFLQNKLFIHPKFSHIQNIGFDAEGTHCAVNDIYLTTTLYQEPLNINNILLQENKMAWNAYTLFFKKHKKKLISRIIASLLRKKRKVVTFMLSLLRNIRKS